MTSDEVRTAVPAGYEGGRTASSSSVMRSLRRLADGGRTVIVVTHSVAQLNICDYVLVLADGRTAYFGPPEEALPYFEADDWADVFHRLHTPAGAASYPGSMADPLWEHSAAVCLFDIGACAAVGVASILVTALLLRRGDPKIIRRARPPRVRVL